MKSFKILILSFLTIGFASNITSAQTESKSLPKLESIETIEVKVKGVGCADDIKSIAASVENLAGVSRCKTIKKGATTKFEVYMLPSMISKAAIHEAIEGTPGCKNPNDRPYKVKQ